MPTTPGTHASESFLIVDSLLFGTRDGEFGHHHSHSQWVCGTTWSGKIVTCHADNPPTPKALTPTVVVCCYVCAYKSDIMVQHCHFLGERGSGIRKVPSFDTLIWTFVLFFVQSIFIALNGLLSQWSIPTYATLLWNSLKPQQFGGTKMPLHRLYTFVAWHDLVHNKGSHQFTTRSLGVRFRNVDCFFLLLEMVVPLYMCDLHQLSRGLLDLWLVSCQSSALLAICSTKSSFLASWSA